MKSFLTAVMLGMAILCSAADVNLVGSTKWKIYGKNDADSSTVIQKNGQIDCFVKGAKKYTGVTTGIIFKKPITGTLNFGADVKADKVAGVARNNFCIYMDITYADKTNYWGLLCIFKDGTYDWKKMSNSFKIPKPISRINFYVLFRNMTGKASFRNIYLYNK